MSNEQDASILRDARRYRRLQILGAAPGGSLQLKRGTVLCFTNLDAFVDADLKLHPSRGEAHPVADAHPEEPQDEARRLAADLLNFALGDLEWVRAQGGRHSVCPLCHCVCERDGGPGHADDCPRIELARRFDTLYPPVRAALPDAGGRVAQKEEKSDGE